MVAASVPVTVPAAWQPRGEIFTGEDARPGQQQRFNHLNPASIDSWIVRVRAYLDDRECLDAIVSPQIKEAAAFAAETTVSARLRPCSVEEEEEEQEPCSSGRQ